MVFVRHNGRMSPFVVGPLTAAGALSWAGAAEVLWMAAQRLLEQSLFNSIDGAVEFPTGAVAAPYAAVVSRNYDEHYGGHHRTVARGQCHWREQSL